MAIGKHENLRRNFDSGLTKPLAFRKQQLLALRSFLVEQEGQILAALKADLGKPMAEALQTEILFTIEDLRLYSGIFRRPCGSRRSNWGA